MKPPSVKQVEEAVRGHGYAWFDNGKPYNLNIVGIRNQGADAKVNQFDDLIMAAWLDGRDWVRYALPATTDPGLYWLRRLINPKGCAILVPGQYRGTYRIDYHRGAYKALCQRGGPVKVYRDKNRNDIVDLDPKTVDVGWFGINIHRANPSGVTEMVNRWSAGCQVIADANDFASFMRVCERARGIYGNSFTYTLIEEQDIP